MEEAFLSSLYNTYLLILLFLVLCPLHFYLLNGFVVTPFVLGMAHTEGKI